MKFSFAVCLLVGRGKTDCLPSALLESLEFSLNSTGVSFDSNSSICSGLAADSGFCASHHFLNAKLFWNQQALASRWTALASLPLVLDALTPRMNATSSSLTVSNEVSELKKTVTARYHDCYQLLSRLQMGTNCVLGSGRAGQYTRQEGSSLYLLVSDQTAQNVEAACFPTYDALCLLAAGHSLSGKLKMDPVYYGVTGNIMSACNAITAAQQCNQGDCLNQKRSTILTWLTTPFDYTFLPRKEVLDALKTPNWSATSWQNSFQPAKPGDLVVRLRLDPVGVPLAGFGESAGVEPASIPVIPHSAANMALGLALIFLVLAF